MGRPRISAAGRPRRRSENGLTYTIAPDSRHATAYNCLLSPRIASARSDVKDGPHGVVGAAWEAEKESCDAGAWVWGCAAPPAGASRRPTQASPPSPPLAVLPELLPLLSRSSASDRSVPVKGMSRAPSLSATDAEPRLRKSFGTKGIPAQPDASLGAEPAPRKGRWGWLGPMEEDGEAEESLARTSAAPAAPTPSCGAPSVAQARASWFSGPGSA